MRAPILCAVLTAFVACGVDWRIEPCAAEMFGRCHVGEIVVDGESRSYLVSRVDDLDCSSGNLPIVLFFHGSGGNGASGRAQVNETWDDLALEEAIAGRALVVYPDGLSHRDCFGRTCWDRNPQGRDVAFFDALPVHLAAQYCVDPERVFAIGHSRGGRFVEVLACERSHALLAAASIGAGAGNVDRCTGQLPIWLSHGVDDRVISFAEGEQNRNAWSGRNGCRSEAADYPLDTCTEIAGCRDASPVWWCPTTESDWNGHAVSGLADESIWDFFSSFR